jgi:transposase-like protein
MSAPRKFDDEFRARAVGMYKEQVAQRGVSKAGTRRRVGDLLDVNPATLRNWIEAAERASGDRPGLQRPADSDEVRQLRRRVAELERANEILKTASAFFAQAELDRKLR